MNSTDPNRSARGSLVRMNDEGFRTLVKDSGVPTVVVFGADWCAPCKIMKARLAAISENLPEVRFVELDVSEAPETAAEYGIRSVPTFMTFKDNLVTAVMLGAVTSPALANWIEEGLA